MSDIVERLHREKERHQLGVPSDNHSVAVLLYDAAITLSEAEQRVKDERRVALEEAALWHDQEITSLDEKISENNSYRDRIGAGAGISLANDYCRELQSQHRLSAAAIRSLQSEER